MSVTNLTRGRDAVPPPSVKLGAIDLNLLVVFDALMQERNVTRAGQRLGLSQPLARTCNKINAMKAPLHE
jgi:hypothetical protein